MAKGGVQNAIAKDVFNVIQDYDSVQGGIGHMEEGHECEAALKHGVYGGGAIAAAPTLAEFLNSRQSTHYSDTEFCVF